MNTYLCILGDDGKLLPSRAVMSSEHSSGTTPASLCIDGSLDTMCHSGNGYTDPFPWLALQYDGEMEFTKVVVHNRKDARGDRTKNVKIFACSGLPQSVSEYVAGCQEFASFQGPVQNGKAHTFEGTAVGKVLVIQMKTNIVNLQEIEAYGKVSGNL